MNFNKKIKTSVMRGLANILRLMCCYKSYKWMHRYLLAEKEKEGEKRYCSVVHDPHSRDVFQQAHD